MVVSIVKNVVGHLFSPTPNQLRRRILLFAAIVVFFIIRKRKQRQRDEGKTRLKPSAVPMLAYSGGGVVWAYYHGINAYLRDHFELDDCRITAISAGCTAASALVLKLPTLVAFQLGLSWKGIVDRRRLGPLFMDFENFILQGKMVNRLAKVTDATVRKFQRDTSRDNSSVGGSPKKSPSNASAEKSSKDDLPRMNIVVTDMWMNHQYIDDLRNVDEYLYAMCCSSCIFPFFKHPGWWRNGIGYVVDGAFGGMFGVPYEYQEIPERVAKVSAFAYPFAEFGTDMCASLLDRFLGMLGIESQFSDAEIEAVVAPSLWEVLANFRFGMDYYWIAPPERCIEHFAFGYRCAARAHDKFLNKGFKQLREPTEDLRSLYKEGVILKHDRNQSWHTAIADSMEYPANRSPFGSPDSVNSNEAVEVKCKFSTPESEKSDLKSSPTTGDTSKHLGSGLPRSNSGKHLGLPKSNNQRILQLMKRVFSWSMPEARHINVADHEHNEMLLSAWMARLNGMQKEKQTPRNLPDFDTATGQFVS